MSIDLSAEKNVTHKMHDPRKNVSVSYIIYNLTLPFIIYHRTRDKRNK